MIDEDLLLEENIDNTRAILRFSHIGDIILLTGVLLWRYKEFNERFVLLTSKGMSAIFKYNPAIIAVEELDKEDLRGKALVSTAKRLAEDHPYILYDMHGTLRSQIIRFFWKMPSFTYAKDALARRIYLLSSCLPSRIRLEALDKHVVERYASNFSSLIPSAYELRPHIFLDKNEEDFAKAFYKKRNPDKRKVVVLHPFATLKGKLWSESNWQELYMELCKREYFPLFIGKKDPLKDKADSFNFIAPVHNAIDAFSLRESVSLMKEAECVITGDSAPLHMAMSVDSPVIALFGATAKEWGFFPLGRKDILLTGTKRCSPCSLHGKKNNCPYNYACINDITLEDVLKALEIIENTEIIEEEKEESLFSQEVS